MKSSQKELAELFLALSNETRLHLLNLLGNREVCVCELVEALDQPQPKISQHLAFLRKAGIVAARREGKWMHYRIVHPPQEAFVQILEATLSCLKKIPGQEKNKKVTARKCSSWLARNRHQKA